MFSLSKLEWLALAGAVLLSPGISRSDDSSLFDRLDRNKDGYLSREELSAEEIKNRNWIAVDRDRDGRISRAEFNIVNLPTPGTPQPAGSAATGGTAAPAAPAAAPQK